jgi:RHS repeat-associated protein
VQCFQANAGAPAAPDKICGVMENATKIWDFTNVDSLRPNRQETWYGANPIPDKFTAPNGTTTDGCTNSTASAPCWQDDFTGFNPRASEYTTVIRSSNSDILSASRGATRANTTAWVCPATGTPPPQCNPLGTGIWLPKLYSSKTVTDTPCTFAPCAVTTDFDFDTATGFLNFTSVNDGPTVWMKRSFTRDLTPGAPGDPLTESFTASFDGTTFTNTRAFQSGLATSSRRTAPPGIAWKEFDVDRNTSTGLIATSRDPNGLATTYQYDALSRLTSINPPGGDLATTYCYNDWVPSSPSGRPYVLVKKGGSVCLPDDGAPGLGSGSFEAYQYDGRGRLVRQAKRLPNALAGTGSSVFSFKEIRYNSAGLKSFESEWVPCAVTAGPNNVTSCFSTPALPGNATSYSNFDFLGRPKTVLAPDGFITTRSFDDVSAVPNSDFFEFDTFSVGGRTVKGGFRKDILGRTLLVAEPGESPPAPYGWVSSYNYNVLDKLAAVNVPIGSGDVRDLPQPPAPPITPQTRTFTYDALGLLRSEFHPEKGTTTYTDAAAYDALGNVKKKTEAGHTYAYAYDAVGRLRTVSADTSPYVSNFYDGQAFAGGTFPLGRLTQQNGYHPLSSPNVQVQQNYTYSSPAGRLSSKSSNAINGISFFNASESFTYNALGLLDTHDHARTSGSSSVTTGYRSGLPTQITSNGASYVSSVTYNPAGGLQSYMTGNGVMTTITQDPALLPRPRSISTSGADQNFSAGPYFYDSVGNVMSIGSDAFEYDVRSRLTKATYASFGPQVDTLKYDAFGNLTRRDFEGSQFQDLATSAATNRLNSATYDTLGNLTLNGSDQHFYDTLSRQTQYTGSGASERYFCDGAGERLARVVSAISLPQQSSQERFFNLTPCRILDTRDPAGTYGGPSIAGQGSRSFPVAGRCGIPANAKSLALNVTTVSATTTGNVRLFPTGLSYQPPGTANAYKVGYTRGNQTFGSIDGPTAASFTLFNDAPAGNSVHVIVDVQGYFAPGPNTPPQTGESWFFTLRDPGNRPSVEYRWDSATSTATLLKDHVYLGNLLVADYTSSGQPNGLVFYTNDHLGTPRFMTEGAVPKWMATYKYRAFGLALTPQIPGQGLEFASMERDLASSDLYDHARYMGGKLPKFNSPDKLGGHVEDPLSWNRYSYARNNPIRYYDPNGKEVADGVQLRKDRDYALATGGPSGLASFDRASMQGLKYGLMAFGAMAAYGAVAEYGPALLAAGQQFLSRFGDRVERAISEANPVLEKVGSDLATKGEAREVLSKMGLPNAQADAVRSAISRATSSDTIDILRSKAGDVVVNLTRPGADGRQVMEYTIGQDGAKIPIQKAYDVFGNLVHLDPK